MKRIKVGISVVFVCVLFLLSYCAASSNVRQGEVNGSILQGESQGAGLNWLSGWQYRKAHNITGSTVGSKMNYQMMISVHYNSGMDFEGDVYLSGKCRADFGDIRFTAPNGIENLDYWMVNKVDSVQAVFWVKINYIPQYPDYTTIYVYYGNASASTTSNKDWTINAASDFESGTKEGWAISWTSYVVFDGVSTYAYQGNYSRTAVRTYGSGNAGVGDFYERFRRDPVYFSSGSYHMECAARFHVEESLKTPKEIRLLMNGITVDLVSSPGTTWHWMSGNFTLTESGYVELAVEFHIQIGSGLYSGAEGYDIDCLLVRRWCDPEPTHGAWGFEATSSDETPPQIVSVEWLPTSPYPLVPSNLTRQGEPVLVLANISEESDGSGINFVALSYRINDGELSNTTMTYNATSGLYTTLIHGQAGNVTVSFFIQACDNAGNIATSSTFSYDVKALLAGDINGDSIIDIFDLVIVALDFGKTG